jgi:hypothetical protein
VVVEEAEEYELDGFRCENGDLLLALEDDAIQGEKPDAQWSWFESS